MTVTSADLRWRLPLGVDLAFSTRVDGDMRDPQHRQAWLTELGVTAPAVVTRQMHGIRVVSAASGPAAEADGLTTLRPGPPLVVFGADCPGLCLVAPDALGLAHCGWRGVAGGMVGSLVAALAARSRHPPAQWQGVIGPAVHPEDYEVDGPVLEARMWPAAALGPARPGRAHLDLPAAITADLAALGCRAVTQATVSTSRDARLWSYRKHGAGLVQGLAAWWR